MTSVQQQYSKKQSDLLIIDNKSKEKPTKAYFNKYIRGSKLFPYDVAAYSSCMAQETVNKDSFVKFSCKAKASKHIKTFLSIPVCCPSNVYQLLTKYSMQHFLFLASRHEENQKITSYKQKIILHI